MRDKRRNIIQFFTSILQNAHFGGFISGQIFKGGSKVICVPGLNCYSCPGALGSCPIGSVQAVIGGIDRNISYYVSGLIILFGAVMARIVCGFLCPFGFIQDILHKIPGRKSELPPGLDKILRYFKYLMLIMVFTFPAVFADSLGIGDPFFCKYVCPAGTLEGGIPLLIKNAGLRDAIGFLFAWKFTILAVTVISSILIYRPFCKYICPLGAVYGLMNRISIFKMQVNHDTCINCNKCIRTCKMKVDVLKNINSPECIRCGQCADVCPVGSISYKREI